ncbi:MAG: insulinase family protein [Gemmatimonadetes bacterium]|nr:insulinase family protein [Gemmatimonadota bacterium]
MTRAIVTGAFAAVLVAPTFFAPTLVAQTFPKTPPPAMPIRAAQFPPFEQATLANGMKLLVVSNHRQPIVSMSLAFSAGSRYDPPGKTGVAAMVAALLTKGAGARNAEAVAEAIEGVGGAMGASASNDFLTVNLGLLTENSRLGIELLADAVMRPSFDTSEVELDRTQRLSSLQLEESQPASIAARALARELYGAHPYGQAASPASVKAIARDDLLAFQRARLRPAGALLVLAGDITLAQARAMANAAFAGWTGTASTESAAAAAPAARAATEIVLVHRPGSVQSNVLIGNLTWGPADQRNYAATIANHVLGGGGDARLFMILREQKGWTYGAYSALTRFQGPGYFSASAEVRTEVTDSSLTEMLTQLRRIRSEPIPVDEFSASMSALVGRFPLEVETAAQVAAQVSSAQLLGFAPDYVQTYRQKLAAVTPASATAAAAAAIQPDRSVVIVVGDGAKLYDKLSAIAPVRIVSVDGASVAAEDLVVKSATLDVDAGRLATRADSFAVFVQGNQFGFQRSKIEKTPTGWSYTEDVQIGPIIQQTTTVTFGADLVPATLSQNGKAQGLETKTSVSYAGGRAKGSATAPQLTGGLKTTEFDAEVVAGTIDNNMLTPLLGAFRWVLGAKFSVLWFQAAKGSASPVTLTVGGEETVTVPAGSFDAWKVDLTGGEQALTFWIEKAAPYRLVKLGFVGAPIEMRLVR